MPLRFITVTIVSSPENKFAAQVSPIPVYGDENYVFTASALVAPYTLSLPVPVYMEFVPDATEEAIIVFFQLAI